MTHLMRQVTLKAVNKDGGEKYFVFESKSKNRIFFSTKLKTEDLTFNFQDQMTTNMDIEYNTGTVYFLINILRLLHYP